MLFQEHNSLKTRSLQLEHLGELATFIFLSALFASKSTIYLCRCNNKYRCNTHLMYLCMQQYRNGWSFTYAFLY